MMSAILSPARRDSLGLMLCRAGVHRWQVSEGLEGQSVRQAEYVTRHRCARVGCRYDHWILVDAQPWRQP